MSNKIWIALTTASVTVLLQPVFPAAADSQLAEPLTSSQLPPVTITELKVTELPTQTATVQPPTDQFLEESATEIPVVAFGSEADRPEQKVHQSLTKLGASIKKRLDSSNAAADTNNSLSAIPPLESPEFFPQPSGILDAPANKENRIDSKKSTSSLGPLDSAEPQANRQIEVLSKNNTNKALSAIPPVEIPEFSPQPSSKERSIDNKKSTSSLGPLDTAEPTENPEIKIPTENILQTQTGQASWYGYEAGNMTATGERYNAQDLTAAHRTLPFGSRVRVTNIRTGRAVVVRINDRGPFVRGRIIDLSAAAAEAVGIKSSGVGNVRLDVLSFGSGKRKPR
jgi:rare lipoprotein A (peptidoglycan hydrolase)